MIDRYGEQALIEVNARIQELDTQKQSEAMQLWVEVRNELLRHHNFVTDNTRH